MSEFKSDFGTEETLKKLLDKILESPGQLVNRKLL